MLFPPRDFQQILQALEMEANAPTQAEAAVNKTIATAGPLRRAVQVGFYYGVEATFQLNATHRVRRTQATYLAWFRKFRKPILLIIERHQEQGGTESYFIGQGDLVGPPFRILFPLLILTISIYMAGRRKPSE
jgi:hypothetical protein